MLFTRFKALVFSLIVSIAAGAAVPQNPILSRYVVVPPSDAVMRAIAEKFEVEKRLAEGFVVIVPAPEAGELLKLAPRSVMIEADMAATLKAKVASERGWHSFDTVQTHLQKLVQTYPDLASVEKYGASMEGRPLNVLRLLSKVRTGRSKPQIVITAATHGDEELITVEVVLGLVEALVSGYGTDARITKMVDTHELYFIPVINPDGYVRQERYANGIDPNRNYPYPLQPDRNPNPAIKAVMNFFAAHDVKGSMDYHSAAGMVMYPWAYTYDLIPEADRTVFESITKKMAQTNGYTHGPIATTIYIAPGSSADYYYWKFNTRALGIEIAEDGSSSLIPSMLEENKESTWRFIESF